MSALKDIYSPVFYDKLTVILSRSLPEFDKIRFMSRIYRDGFEHKELKDRMRHTAKAMHCFMPEDFNETVPVLEHIIKHLREATIGEDSLAYMFLPDYIETYGINNYDAAIKALEFTTQFTSCEFAVRPFLLQYPEQMMKQMKAWSLHENHKVRRLASEGSRPRLPWAMAIPYLKKDPTAVLPLLENLKNDPSEWVRRSVANNINDIAKDNPGVVIELAKQWKGNNKETDAIIKHGCRTLLKQAHPEVLRLYGLDSTNMILSSFEILTPTVKMGDSVEFTFTIENKDSTPQTVRLEYGLYYKKSKGHLARKVFKISERIFQPGEKSAIIRKQSFRPITTRVFYPGDHELSLIVNGEEKAIAKFELI